MYSRKHQFHKYVAWKMLYSTTTILLTTLIIIIYNIYVLYKLIKNDDYSYQQKIFQGFIIWCIPIIGAIFIHQFMTISNKKHYPPKSFANKVDSSSHMAEGEGD
jgi:hypothetical protein